jgi:hypothetical protein
MSHPYAVRCFAGVSAAGDLRETARPIDLPQDFQEVLPMVGTRTKNTLRKTAAAVICLAACVVPAGCSSGAATPEVASLASNGATSAAGASGGVGGAKSDPGGWVGYAKCMRDHGIDMPDPQPGGQISFGDSAKQDSAKLNAAMDACRSELPAGKGSGPLSPADQVRALQRAQCLRAHGVPVQDPQPGQDLVISGSHLDAATVQAAVAACRQPSASASVSASAS